MALVSLRVTLLPFSDNGNGGKIVPSIVERDIVCCTRGKRCGGTDDDISRIGNSPCSSNGKCAADCVDGTEIDGIGIVERETFLPFVITTVAKLSELLSVISFAAPAASVVGGTDDDISRIGNSPCSSNGKCAADGRGTEIDGIGIVEGDVISRDNGNGTEVVPSSERDIVGGSRGERGRSWGSNGP